MKSSVLESFKNIVADFPDNPALQMDGEKECSYRELDSATDGIASVLRKKGLSKEHVAGIFLPKSPDYVTALLGIWKSGAAFIPFDPDLPRERLEYIIKDSGVAVCITSSKYREAAEASGLSVICIDEINFTEDNSATMKVEFEDRDLAYIIYTSGSTGKPKGVQVEHRGLMNLFREQIKALELSSNSRSLFYLSTSFDASVSDIGTALMSGACLCMADKENLAPGSELYGLIERMGITYIDIPPSVLQILSPEDMPECLTTLLIGGEVCRIETVRKWSKRVRLINVYGPTEATVCTSLSVCEAQSWRLPLIGDPLKGVEYHVLDNDFQSVPDGEAGELFIGGNCLARGYLNNPELTEKKFIQISGERFYRSGDKVRKHTDGSFEFCGRIDRMIKLRGMLIELEEVEAVLSTFSEIKKAACVVRSLKAGTAPVLVAFLLVEKAEDFNKEALKVFLKDKIPEWMIPAFFKVMDSIPINSSGKTDLQYLRECSLEHERLEVVKPESETEEKLLELWKSVLKLEELSVTESFFDLGGTSINVLEFVIAAEKEGLKFSPAILNDYPTIKGLAECFETQDSTESAEVLTAEYLRKEALSLMDFSGLKKRPEFVSKKKKIFLTGATGFLGSWLLQDLLKKTDAEIYCLVRAEDSEKGFTRIKNTFKKYNFSFTEEYEKRLEVLPGDLTLHGFGLNSEKWKMLSGAVDTIYHLAAVVDIFKPFGSLRKANLDSCKEIVRLHAEGIPKELHYASTLSVFVGTDKNTGVVREDNELENTGYVYGGYAQTKWAAEVFMRHAGEALNNVFIYRFGLITGDTGSGIFPDKDLFSMFCEGVISILEVPEGAKKLEVDITPVDYAAQAMAAISLADKRSQNSTYHIANKTGLTLEKLIANINTRGNEIRYISDSEWYDKYEPGQQSELSFSEQLSLLALCRVFPAEVYQRHRTMDLFQAGGIEFDTFNTEAILGGEKIKCPEITAQLLVRYLDYIYS